MRSSVRQTTFRRHKYQTAVAVVAAAAAANDNNDENDDDDDDGVDLDALRRRVHDLRRMLDASANRLAHAEGSSVDGG